LNLLKEDSETGAVDFVEDFKMNLYSKKFMYPKEILSPPKNTGLRL
jgi:hypothetical protein